MRVESVKKANVVNDLLFGQKPTDESKHPKRSADDGFGEMFDKACEKIRKEQEDGRKTMLRNL